MVSNLNILKKFSIVIVLIALFFISPYKSVGQEIQRKYAIGLNLPPLIGNTIDVKVENNWKPHWTMQLALGCMINNKQQGSWIKVHDGTEDWRNSGVFSSVGLRFNTRKLLEKNTLFVGTKLLGGYFFQSAINSQNDQRFEREGKYGALCVEVGATIKLYKKLSMDIGMHYARVFYSDKQASSLFSVLPGIGALGNVQGILVFKYFI